MQNYITLFDKNYLSRGLVLYNSLVKNTENFTLFVLTMDSESYEYLTTLNFFNLKLIKISDIETYYEELPNLKLERTVAEYCWTLTPYCIQYAIKKFKLDTCTYLDADICFYDDPIKLIQRAKGKSVIITEHNYTPMYDQTSASGKYCVQFMYFKNDCAGTEVLEWWRLSCKEWCFNRMEEGKFGDQKYLDDWLTRFNCVYIPNTPGIGVAPWNMQKFNISNENGKLIVQDKITKETEQIMFYHFHGVKDYVLPSGDNYYFINNYDLSTNCIDEIYIPYLNNLYEIEKNFPENFLNKTNVENLYLNKVSFSFKEWIKKILKNSYQLIKALLYPVLILRQNIRNKKIPSGKNYIKIEK